MSPPPSPKVSRFPPSLICMYFLLGLELAGTGLAGPIMSWFLMSDLKLDPLKMGWTQTGYAVSQVIGSVFFGRVSDASGRKPLIILAFFWSALGFLFTALSWDFWSVLAARTFAGFSGGSISVTQAYVLDGASEKNRGGRLGCLGAVVAVAFMVGPASAGLIREYGVLSRKECILVAAGICFATALLGFPLLSESLSKEKRRPFLCGKREVEEGAEKPPSILSLISLCPSILLVWGARFLSAFSTYAMYTTQSYLVKDIVKVDDGMFAFILSGAGFLSAISMGGVYPLVDRALGRQKTVAFGLLVAGVALALCFPLAQLGLVAYCLVSALYVLGFGCFDPGFPNLLSLYIPPTHLGAGNGVNTACRAIGQIVGPPVGGALWRIQPGLDYIPSSLSTFCGLLLALVLIRFGKTYSEVLGEEKPRLPPCKGFSFEEAKMKEEGKSLEYLGKQVEKEEALKA